MKFKVMITIFALALMLAGGFVTHKLTTGTPSVLAFDQGNGQLHITKECSADTGLAGDFCTITSSNLAALPVGTRVYYDQAYGIPNIPPAGMLDSNALLSVGTSNWAVGRCTLDGSTGLGLCTFSDGVGPLAGFKARVKVSYIGGVNYAWNGTYSFSGQQD